MFGERYFATRQKLGAVVRDARELAGALDIEPEGFSEESELLQGLQSPFLFVVCGEVNAGKSTLINGLFGEELCAVNVLPETEKVLWYRFGSASRDEQITEILEERYRPVDFLGDFNIVDTPGTNSVVRGHQAITESFLPVADLVLFVFPVSNPWGAATWDFISRFPEELRGKVAFVLQQKDLRDEDELGIIIEHMRDLAQQKMGETPDVFPVSGKQAMAAKQHRPFEDRMWKESGYPRLEEFISRIVTDSPRRRQVLRDVREVTGRALRQIEDQIDATALDLDRRMRVLRDLETSIDRKRDACRPEFEERLEALRQIFQAEGGKAQALLKKRIAIWPSVRSLFCRDKSPEQLEERLSSGIEEAVRQWAHGEAVSLQHLCKDHWDELAPRIREEVGIEPPETESGMVDRAKERERFVRRMARTARQSVIKLKLRSLLEMQLDARRQLLRRYVAGVLLALSAGGALGAAGYHPYPWACLGLALLVGLLVLWQARRTGGRLLDWFSGRLEQAGEEFSALLAEEYWEGLREYFKSHAALFTGVQRELLGLKAQIKPRQEEWSGLFLELKAIEQEL